MNAWWIAKYSDSKIYYTFLAMIFIAVIIMSNASTIFPIMGDDDFFVDNNEVIHNKRCPYRDVPWFTSKPCKYGFMKKVEWEFCRECFSETEIEKLMMIHEYNLDMEEARLMNAGANDEYIKNKMKQYGR